MTQKFTAEQIRQAVLKFISDIAPEVNLKEIVPGKLLRDQIDLDSIDFLRLLTMIHEVLGVNIPESDYAKLVSLEDIIAYLEAKTTSPTPRAIKIG